MQYLLIQNEGVSPVEGYTMLGVSTTRNDKRDGTSGQFGSGSKHAINLCLRNQISPIIFAGNLKMEFDVRPQTINDGLTSIDVGVIHCKMTGKMPDGSSKNTDKDLGFVVEYGAIDWPDLSKGLQELVKNAIDRTVRQDGDFRQALQEGKLSINIVDENQVRAKNGYTRVYIPLTAAVQRFYGELPRRFLHFSEPEILDKKILFKSERNLSTSKGPMIYHQGVFLLELQGQPSLFDYNFGDELQVDESRNVNTYSISNLAARAFKDAPANILTEMFKSLIGQENIWENDLDKYYLRTSPLDMVNPKRQEIWKDAWKNAACDRIVCGASSHEVELVKKKGYHPGIVYPSGWLDAIISNNIPAVTSILDYSLEKEGYEILPAPQEIIDALDQIWNLLSKYQMTDRQTKPSVSSFCKIMDGGIYNAGYYENNTVFINRDLASGGSASHLLLATVLEEVVHHITQASDGSRDIQDFVFNLVVHIINQKEM